MTLTPMIPAFNDVTNLIASRIFPLGFDICRSAPNRIDDLHTALNFMGRMAIWDGEHEDTCFGDTETWRQFRAWHDWVHYRFDCGFTMEGEHKALHIQAGQIMRILGRGDDVVDMIALTFCNIIGPLEATMVGLPKISGREFCETHLDEWRAYARDIRDHQGQTDADACAYAGAAYERRASLGPKITSRIEPEHVLA